MKLTKPVTTGNDPTIAEHILLRCY